MAAAAAAAVVAAVGVVVAAAAASAWAAAGTGQTVAALAERFLWVLLLARVRALSRLAAAAVAVGKDTVEEAQ